MFVRQGTKPPAPQTRTAADLVNRAVRRPPAAVHGRLDNSVAEQAFLARRRVRTETKPDWAVNPAKSRLASEPDEEITGQRQAGARPPAATHAHAEKYYLDVEPADGQAKVEPEGAGKSENGLIGALIGAGSGAAIGALVGGVAAGPLGALIGAGIGALVGGVAGALIGSAGTAISWKAVGYASDGAAGSSTTVEEPFNVTYKAEQDASKGVWRLGVSRIEGGVNIHVHTGGSRDPMAAPPTSQAEARDAVTVMKGYYARGSRGAWHTEAASRRHEEHHVREWKGSAEHYWAAVRGAIEAMTAPIASQPTEAAAVAAMRAGAGGADAKIAALSAIARAYWFTLSDGPASRPYAAGQLTLNGAIENVQGLAAGKGWAVPAGTDSPDPEPPCYQPWLPFAP